MHEHGAYTDGKSFSGELFFKAEGVKFNDRTFAQKVPQGNGGLQQLRHNRSDGNRLRSETGQQKDKKRIEYDVQDGAACHNAHGNSHTSFRAQHHIGALHKIDKHGTDIHRT